MKHLGSSFVVAREGITNKSLNAWCQREWTVLERRVGKAPQIPRAVGSVYVCSGSGASSDPDTRCLGTRNFESISRLASDNAHVTIARCVGQSSCSLEYGCCKLQSIYLTIVANMTSGNECGVE
jgi:hypothetical protein